MSTNVQSTHALEKQLEVLAQIAKKITDFTDFTTIMTFTVNTLGEYTQVSRVYIFEDSADGTTTSNTFEWCGIEVSPQINNLQNVPYAILPTWKEMLQQDGKVLTNDISQLNKNLYDILAPQEIKSILVLPINKNNAQIGFIGFDDTKENRIWEQSQIHLLEIIANLLSNAFIRRESEKKLKENEQRLEFAIEGGNLAMWDWDIPTGNIVTNDRWITMLGYEINELIPHKNIWEEHLHPEDKSRVLNTLNNHLQGSTSYFESEYRLKTKSGEWKWILAKGKIVEWDTKHNPTRAVGTHLDINQRKLTELKLQEQMSNLKKMNEFMVNREMKMMELKEKLKQFEQNI